MVLIRQSIAEAAMPVSLKFNCPAKWSAMEDCGNSRYCQQCEREVHEISTLSEEEAQDIMSTPDTCVRFELNANGQILTRRGFSAALILGSAIAIGCGESTTTTKSTNTDKPEFIEVMGDAEERAPALGQAATENSEDQKASTTQSSQGDCEESTSTEPFASNAEPDNSAAQSATTLKEEPTLSRPAVMGKVRHTKPNKTETRTLTDRLKNTPKK